jgi:N-acetylmuramate 1-kinase
MRELMLFPDWYLGRHKGIELSDAQRQVLHAAFDTILANNLAQPPVFVHRDYHSRNLMVLAPDRNPGILDFQDAVFGPITYDLVSLLRDAYIRWDEQQVLDWAIRYWELARAEGLPVNREFDAFYRDFEWMGLQRHLKVLGIFARLCHRDGKDNYLKDMPLVLDYVLQVLRRYVDLAPLARLVQDIEQRRPLAGYTF